MVKLHGDEDFSRPVVEELRQLGHEVTTAQQAGMAHQGIDDAQVLAFATQQGRVLVTFNRRHFIRLHRSTLSHAGIVVCTRDDDVVALARRISEAIEATPILRGALIRIHRA